MTTRQTLFRSLLALAVLGCAQATPTLPDLTSAPWRASDITAMGVGYEMPGEPEVRDRILRSQDGLEVRAHQAVVQGDAIGLHVTVVEMEPRIPGDPTVLLEDVRRPIVGAGLLAGQTVDTPLPGFTAYSSEGVVANLQRSGRPLGFFERVIVGRRRIYVAHALVREQRGLPVAERFLASLTPSPADAQVPLAAHHTDGEWNDVYLPSHGLAMRMPAASRDELTEDRLLERDVQERLIEAHGDDATYRIRVVKFRGEAPPLAELAAALGGDGARDDRHLLGFPGHEIQRPDGARIRVFRVGHTAYVAEALPTGANASASEMSTFFDSLTIL